MMVTNKTGPKNALLHQIPIEKIEKSSYQTRIHFDPEGLRTLADAIKSKGGLLQLLVVRPHPHKEKFYEIIAGETTLVYSSASVFGSSALYSTPSRRRTRLKGLERAPDGTSCSKSVTTDPPQKSLNSSFKV